MKTCADPFAFQFFKKGVAMKLVNAKCKQVPVWLTSIRNRRRRYVIIWGKCILVEFGDLGSTT